MKTYLFLVFSLISTLVIAQTGVKNPSIMIVPADNLLFQLGCLEAVDNQGVKQTFRDYPKAFRENNELILAINAINKKFLTLNYPTKSMEASLKALENQLATDMVNGVRTDPRTALIGIVKPDIYLDLSYEFKRGSLGSQLSFNLAAIDSYTNNMIASIGNPGLQTTNTNVAQMLADQVERNLEGFLSEINTFFETVRENGRTVTLRIQLDESSELDLENDECNGEFIADLIDENIKANSFKNQFKRSTSSDSQIFYEAISIPLYGEDDVGIDVRDWLKPFVGMLRRTCKYKVSDRSVGVSEGIVIIK